MGVFYMRINFTKLRLSPPFGSMGVFYICIDFAKLRLSPPFGSMHCKLGEKWPFPSLQML